MAKRRTVIIPRGTYCPECGSEDLVGRGTDWRVNPYGDEPPRIKVQQLRCKNCGKIFRDGEVKDNQEE